MNLELITKEVDLTGTYMRRIVTTESGHVVSDERIKRDPIFAFVSPVPVTLAANGLASVPIELTMTDFDGAARVDSGTVLLRLRDQQQPSDIGVTFARPIVDGRVVFD